MIFVLVAFLGMGTDVGYLTLRKRQMQSAADAGALWAVQEIRRGKVSPQPHPDVVKAGEAGTEANLFPDGVKGVQVTVNHPPGGGDFVGDNLAVAVTICQPQRTFFMNVVGFTSADVCARGVAAYAADSPNCIYALNPTDEKTMYVSSSNAVLDAECGVVVNSKHPKGLYVDSGACMLAGSISVTGENHEESGECILDPYAPEEIEPDPFHNSPPEPDPLAHLEPPPMDPDCPPGFDPDTIDYDASFPPQTYCGPVQIQGGAQVTLEPGIHVFRGEIFEISGDTTKVTASGGVMLYFTDWPSDGKPSKGFLVGSGATFAITAPNSGEYEGIAIFVDRDVNAAPYHDAGVRFESGSFVTVNGAIYAKNQIILVHSGSIAGTEGLGLGTVIVGDKVEVTSSDTIADVNADFSFLPGGSPIKKPTLVE